VQKAKDCETTPVSETIRYNILNIIQSYSFMIYIALDSKPVHVHSKPIWLHQA
jgi:hypothetical protein